MRDDMDHLPKVVAWMMPNRLDRCARSVCCLELAMIRCSRSSAGRLVRSLQARLLHVDTPGPAAAASVPLLVHLRMVAKKFDGLSVDERPRL